MSPARPAVSILIATHRRPSELRRTLEGIASCRFEPGYEVLVCDNAGDAETRLACEAMQDRLDIETVVEPRGGKNRALNALLPSARGDLLLFTDDDIRPEPSWIQAMWDAAGRWPEHVCFGGRVLPDWPDEPDVPEPVRSSRYVRVCLSIQDPDMPERPAPSFKPFGTNMGVRRSVFDNGVRYDESVELLGSETELIRRLKADSPPVFVPSSTVYHRIRPEQLSLSWQLRRCVAYGEWMARGPLPSSPRTLGGVPLYLFRELIENLISSGGHLLRWDRTKAWDGLLDAAVAWGHMRWLRSGS